MIVVLILFYLFFPAIVLYLTHRFPVLDKIGAVVICYAVGLILGNSGFLPENSIQYQDVLLTVTIPLALPLLLFSAEVKKWFKLVGKMIISMILAFIAMLIMVISGYFLFKGEINDIWQISGMLVGVYTGGTPNLAAIKTALNVPANIYIMTHTYDLVIGAFYLLFFLTIAQRLFSLFLPAFSLPISEEKQQEKEAMAESIESYRNIFAKQNHIPILKAFGLSVFIFAIGGGISMLVPEKFATVSAILTITTLGILFSFVPRVHRLPKTFQTGMYFILIFSLVVASMADISNLVDISPYLFYYVAWVVLGTTFLHVMLSAIFRIDTDTVIITSTALIMSPPFVPVVAGALHNRQIIISGLTIGIIGYAIGNYIGVFVAYALK